AERLRNLQLTTFSSVITAWQLAELLQALQAEAERISGELTTAFQVYIAQAVEAGSGYSKAILIDAFRRAGIDTGGVVSLFATINRQAIEACWARTRNGLFLSDKIWEKSEKARDVMRDIIQEAVATGQEAVETARMLEQYVKNGTRTLARQYPDMMKRMAGRIPKDLSYEALRLARTEMTAAFGEGTILAARVLPS